ncbi:MAG: uroporphyrinogen-III synthase [Candidatus Eisenbacteria bacterium]
MIAGAPTGPLARRRVAVTRAREQAGPLAEALERLGARVLLAAAIELVDPPDFGPLDAALGRLSAYDWIVFTSANTLPRLVARMEALGQDLAELARVPARLVAIGPATARGLEASGLAAYGAPEEFRAEGVVEFMSAEPLAGRRILIPRALEARDVLERALAAAGAIVEVAPTYCTRPWPGGVARARAALLAGDLDAVTFTSGGIARAFVEAIGDARPTLLGITRASIGPVTSEALRGLGLAPQVEAREATRAALVAALVEHYAGPWTAPEEEAEP